MQISTVKVGPIATNCYIAVEGREAIVIDPGAQGDLVISRLAELGHPEVKYVVLTHGHWDHIGAAPAILKETGARLLCHERDAYRLFDADNLSRVPSDALACFAGGKVAGVAVEYMQAGDVIGVAGKEFAVISAPGHTQGSVCLHCAEENVLFAGDTLFAGGGYGRTDFEGGSTSMMIETLSTKFRDVSDDCRVYSGHGESSLMRVERKLNPYLV